MLLYLKLRPMKPSTLFEVLGTKIELHVRDVGGLGICIMGGQFFVFVPEIAGNKPQYSVGCFAAFLGLFLPLEVFGDDDS